MCCAFEVVCAPAAAAGAAAVDDVEVSYKYVAYFVVYDAALPPPLEVVATTTYYTNRPHYLILLLFGCCVRISYKPHDIAIDKTKLLRPIILLLYSKLPFTIYIQRMVILSMKIKSI